MWWWDEGDIGNEFIVCDVGTCLVRVRLDDSINISYIIVYGFIYIKGYNLPFKLKIEYGIAKLSPY